MVIQVHSVEFKLYPKLKRPVGPKYFLSLTLTLNKRLRANRCQIRAAVDPLGAADADLRRVLLHVHVPLPAHDDHDSQLRPLLPHHQFQVRNLDLDLRVRLANCSTSSSRIIFPP